jgi:hypothetical protein
LFFLPPYGSHFSSAGSLLSTGSMSLSFHYSFRLLLIIGNDRQRTFGVCVCVCVCVCNLAGESGVERRQVTRQSSSPISPTPLEKRKAAGGKNQKTSSGESI